jgi:hypothetical protein
MLKNPDGCVRYAEESHRHMWRKNMAKKKAEVSWSAVKQELQSWETDELFGLVQDLFKLSAENRLFLAAHLLGKEAIEPLLDPYRQRIKGAFYKRSGKPRNDLQMGDACKLIRDYQAATSDPDGTLELMLTFVETGTAFSREFGDIGTSFYNHLSVVLGDIVRLLRDERGSLYGKHRERFLKLAERAKPIGWGYGDEVRGTVARLEDLFADESVRHPPGPGLTPS